MKGTKFFGIGTTLVVSILALVLVAEVWFIPTASAVKPERYCVTFEKAARKAVKDTIKANFGNAIKKELKLVDAVVVSLPSPEDARKLEKIPGVKSIVRDEIFIQFAGGKGKPSKPPKPAEEKLPWGVDRIDADKVWDSDGNLEVDPGANTGYGIKVAIVDSGVDLDHPDLAENLRQGWNTVDDQDPYSPYDEYGHGTLVSGVVAAVDNDVGVIGVGPGIFLYPVKLTSGNDIPSQHLSDVLEAMEWCIQNGMQVVNMSFSIWTLGGNGNKDKPLHYSPFYNLIEQAYNAGIVLVASAGNEERRIEVYDNPGSDYVDDQLIYAFPASYTEVIAVSATGMRKGKPGKRDYLASSSNYGPAIELAAPGVSLETTTMGGGYGSFGGTSAACPHVVGVAALALAAGVKDVRGTLQSTAEDLGEPGWDESYGYGLVDAETAVDTLAAPHRHIVSSTGKLPITWGKLKGK